MRIVCDNENLILTVDNPEVRIATLKNIFDGSKKECEDKIKELKLKDKTKLEEGN